MKLFLGQVGRKTLDGRVWVVGLQVLCHLSPYLGYSVLCKLKVRTMNFFSNHFKVNEILAIQVSPSFYKSLFL